MPPSPAGRRTRGGTHNVMLLIFAAAHNSHAAGNAVPTAVGSFPSCGTLLNRTSYDILHRHSAQLQEAQQWLRCDPDILASALHTPSTGVSCELSTVEDIEAFLRIWAIRSLVDDSVKGPPPGSTLYDLCPASCLEFYNLTECQTWSSPPRTFVLGGTDGCTGELEDVSGLEQCISAAFAMDIGWGGQELRPGTGTYWGGQELQLGSDWPRGCYQCPVRTCGGQAGIWFNHGLGGGHAASNYAGTLPVCSKRMIRDPEAASTRAGAHAGPSVGGTIAGVAAISGLLCACWQRPTMREAVRSRVLRCRRTRHGMRETMLPYGGRGGASRASEDIGHCLADGIATSAPLSMLCTGTSPSATLEVQPVESDDELLISSSEIELRHAIGSGGMGVVYEGSWLGTTVAVKVLIHTEERDAAETRRRSAESLLLREARMLSGLRHPNVCRFFGTTLVDGASAIVIECCRCGSVTQLLQQALKLQKAIDWGLTCRIGCETASGLAYLHRKGQGEEG